MTRRPIAPGPRDERGVLAARILDAARESFAEHGSAGTTIRAVARATDVDPALVYHYFGSKAGLLDASTAPPPRWLETVATTWTTSREDLAEQLLRTVMSSWDDDEIGPTLRAVVLTAAHEPTTRDKLRAIVERSLIGESTLGSDESERLKRSALIATQLIGFALIRYVWKIEPIASMTEEQVLAAMVPVLQHYVDGDLDPST